MHTDLIHASSTYQSLHPKWHLDRFSHFCTAHGRESLYFRMAAPSALKIAPLQYMEVKEEAQDREGWRAKCQKPTGNSRRLERWGISTPSNTWFLGPTRVHNPNGISIASAVFAGLTIVADRPTNRPCYSICNNRPHLRTVYIVL